MNFSKINIQDLQLQHALEVNPSSGSVSGMVNVPLTEGRNGFGPELSLQYSSSSRNSIFGLGWSLSGLPFISVDTKNGLPKYDGSDNYAFNGSISIVPQLVKSGSSWVQKIEENADFWIYYFIAKNGDAFTRFEKWIKKASGEIHWRTRSKNNVLSIYGLEATGLTKISDPENKSKIFIWLLEAQYDNLGNAIHYKYKIENNDNINPLTSYETNRVRKFSNSGFAQKYPERILYGNTKPILADEPIPANNKWLFQAVFDCGEYQNRPYSQSNPLATAKWSQRQDPYSVYNAGFEIRTYRLCRRILMFHHFDELGGTSLTGILECKYNEKDSGSTLNSISYTGIRRDLNTGLYTEKQLPELTIKYTEPVIGQSFKGTIKESNENLPQGFNHIKTRLVDLFGEGLPGILTESANTWYYKPNLGGGVFGKQETVIQKPSQDMGIYSLGDFDQDGNLNLFALKGRTAGYYEFDRDKEKWSGFKALQNIPQVGHSRFMDIDGDGYPDLVVELDDKIISYPFKGKEGFEKPFEFSKPVSNGVAHAPTIGDNLALDYFQADMTGDGLPDQVRIKNGRVEYYPNLGNGHFGEVVLMENSPVIDFDNTFDASRIRLYDLDGTGTTDILYIGNGEIRYWFNASGNKFIYGGRITNLPYIDNLSSAIILDLLGQGTPCLVWSNSLNYAQNSPIQYLELTNGIKPRILISIQNGLGKEEQIEYGYSGLHFLNAKRNGKPWISKIPSHFTVADKKIVIDHITNTRFITEYKYYDGHYDGNERSFVAFGLVEQYDTELFENASITHEKGFAQPSCTRTWIHNGIFGGQNKRSKQFYSKDPQHQVLIAQTFEDTDALDSDEFQHGYRTLAGKIIRQEIYATSPEGELAEHPYQVSQNSYRIRKLQPKNKKYDSCFFCYQSETLNQTYDQQANDPKINHHFSVLVNEYGDIEKTLNVAYARRSSAIGSEIAQNKDYITLSRHSLLNKNALNEYQTGILFEAQDYEVNFLIRNQNELLNPEYIQSAFDGLIANAISFDQVLSSGGSSQARLISWDRTFFWNNNFDDILPLGQTGNVVFAHHEESACFNDNLINQAFNGKVTPAMLADANEGNYSQKDGYWWQTTAINHVHGSDRFYNLEKVERATGNVTNYKYDSYHLNIIEITDPLGNVTKGTIDYNIVEPCKLIDQNDNVSEVLYDPLGVAVVTTHQGTVLDDSNTVKKYGNNLIDDYAKRNDESFDNILASPSNYLQQADSFLYYDFDCWRIENKPLRSIRLTRENLVHDGKGNVDNAFKILIGLDYQDGYGRIIQSKQKVEPGQAIQRKLDGGIDLDTGGEPIQSHSNERWLVSGHVVYNNKVQPVRQFEPFFSNIVEFENDAALETYGVSAQLYYDAVGRNYRTDFPNSTFIETKYTPWEVTSYDQNDTVDRSLYKTFREILPSTAPERMALDKSLAHKETPSIIKFDPLGRAIVTIEQNNDETERKIENRFDINGNISEIIDARNLKAFEYKRDMLGRQLFEKSIDAGEKWAFHNNLDQTIHLWDSRNIHQRTHYDQLDRVITIHVDGALGLNQITERFVYGEDASVVQAKEKNLKGQLVIHYDQAGIQELKLAAPGGIPLVTERKLLNQFTSEPNWSNPATVGLAPEIYISKYTYDALGRPVQQELPDKTTRKFLFNQGGGVQKVLVSTADGVMNEVEILKNISYDAKGLRETALLGNDVETVYTYDSETFHLKRLRSRKVSGVARNYQDIRYTYDPVGNLIHLVDEAQQPTAPNPHVLEGLNVSAHSEFEYDALYQLKSAKGRVHQALLQNDYADRSREAGVPANWGKGTRHITLNNAATVERYTRTYEYDVAGNIKTIRHNGASKNWTKQIWTSDSSNRSLPLLDLNGIAVVNPENRFDANGNCIYMPHLRSLEWNYRNNISKAVVIDRSLQGTPNDEEYYVYGGDGMRVRKITQRVVDVANNTVELTEKVYLDGCEIKRITRGGTEILKRFTSQISDGTNNLALIHSWEKDTQARETDDLTQKKIHYQLANHLGSASLELDENGDVITYEEYFPFGGTSFIAGRNKRDIDLKHYRYSGKERDDFTGLYYFGYRYYAHWMGGWINPDPLGPEDSENLYLYVHNNPINLVDPNGLQSQQRLYRRKQLRTAEEARRHYEGRVVIMDGQRFRLSNVTITPSTEEGTQWIVDGTRTPVDRQGRPIPPPIPQNTEASDDGTGDQPTTTIEPAPDNGSTGETASASENPDNSLGGTTATGPTGEAADSTGTGRSDDTGNGGTNDGTGEGGSQVQNNPGGGGNTGDGRVGSGTQGPGHGEGQRGTGTGAGGNNTGPTATGTGTGTTPGNGAGAGNRPGSGTGSSTGTRGGQGQQGADNPGNGQQGGQVGGSQNGVQGGQIGGSADGALGGQPEGDPRGSLNGDINGVPDGIPNGTLDGSQDGAEGGTGNQPVNGTPPSGQGTGEQQGDGNANQQRNNDQQGQQGQGQQGDPRRNFMDDVVKVAGYFNLEFGSDAPGGEAGGVPGGMDLFGWRPPMWVRRTLQVVYVALTVITTIIPIGKAALAAKVALQGALKVGLRAAARQLLTRAAALIPSRAAIRGVLTRARGAIGSVMSRIGSFFLGSRRVGQRTGLGRKLFRFFLEERRTFGASRDFFNRWRSIFGRGHGWSMEHMIIKQRWYRGANPIFARGTFMNRALQRLGDAGWNLVPLPRGLNSWLYRHPIVSGLFNWGTYGGIGYGTYAYYRWMDRQINGDND
ncbi:MAG: hypothetical protein KF803_02765 [Cyclobacteriaceae bacterium]|nr:hypothetical protein [Cyclobacteriaceae bacterium]